MAQKATSFTNILGPFKRFQTISHLKLDQILKTNYVKNCYDCSCESYFLGLK